MSMKRKQEALAKQVVEEDESGTTREQLSVRRVGAGDSGQGLDKFQDALIGLLQVKERKVDTEAARLAMEERKEMSARLDKYIEYLVNPNHIPEEIKSNYKSMVLNQQATAEDELLSEAVQFVKTRRIQNQRKTISFSSKELDTDHLEHLGLKLQYVGPHNEVTFFVAPSEPVVEPSSWLCDTLERVLSAWVLNNEKSRRIVIDAIITEVISSDKELNAAGHCEVKLDWDTSSFSFSGNADYLIGSKHKAPKKHSDWFLLVVEAKKEWSDQAIWQLLAQSACIQNHRISSQSPNIAPVFAVLTNGFRFQFFAVDDSKQVFCGPELTIVTGGAWKSNNSLKEVLRWFNWILGCMKAVSSRQGQSFLSSTQNPRRAGRAEAEVGDTSQAGGGVAAPAAAVPVSTSGFIDRYADFRKYLGPRT